MFTSFNARAVGLRLSASQTIDLAAWAGFEGVDLLVRDLVDAGEDPRRLRARMDRLGLRGGAWPLPVDWRTAPIEHLERQLAELPRYAEAAAILGLHRTGTWLRPEIPCPGFPEGLDPRDPFAVSQFHDEQRNAWLDHDLRILERIAAILASHGSRLGLEAIGVESARSGRGIPLVQGLTSVWLRRMVERLNASLPNPRSSTNPVVGVLLDAFHLFAAGESVEDGLSWGVENVVWVHLADVPGSFQGDRSSILDHERGLPGEAGVVESATILQRLATEGYSGPVTAEPLGNCATLANLGPEPTARLVAESLQRLWPVVSRNRTTQRPATTA